jgi:sec-independent protein translocase protein TatA
MGIGVTELLIILVIVLVLFGASKLTKTMGDLGKGVRAFKDGLKEEDQSKKE